MNPATINPTAEVDLLRLQGRTTQHVVRLCVDGVTHQESLVRPHPGGNCLNWVLGHLVWAYEGALPLLGQQQVLEEGAVKRYARGSEPLQDPSEARDFGELTQAFDQAADRFDAGLAALTPEVLNRAAPNSPTGNPNETVRSLLTTLLFHQAYHAGQTGVLRRISGKAGAIR